MAVPARIRNQAAVVMLLAAAGCGGGPPVADWQLNALQAVQGFERNYLAGDTKASEVEFQIARRELARTGRPDVVAQGELRRCAVRVASLEFDDCFGFEALRNGATKEQVDYADYLRGRGSHATSEDPLSRLVALSVKMKKGEIAPAEIGQAVDIASAQGWRRPLLAWLGVQLRRAEAAGDSDAAARLRQRIALVSQ